MRGSALRPALEIARTLHPADRERCADLLARAFRDNPLNAAVIRSPRPDRRLRANRAGMRALLPVALAHGHVRVARVGGRPVGVLVATEPGGFPLPAPPLRVQLRTHLAQGLRVSVRWAECFEQLSSLHPPVPHGYLSTLGTEPSLQGRGIGDALLRAWLERVDAQGVPAYLETDREANVAFYTRAGFAVEGESPVLGARVWRLLRPPVRRSG